MANTIETTVYTPFGVYAIGTLQEAINTTVDFDTGKSIIKTISDDFDIQKKVIKTPIQTTYVPYEVYGLVNTTEETNISELSDTERVVEDTCITKITVPYEVYLITRESIVNLNSDTEFNVSKTIDTTFDTNKVITEDTEESVDTKLEVKRVYL